MLRSWTNRYRDEDITASLAALEYAIGRTQVRWMIVNGDGPGLRRGPGRAVIASASRAS
jgi:hypothetical protein